MRMIIAQLSACLILNSCGQDNFLSSTEKEDPKEKAAIALEQQHPDEAISILNKALADDPGNSRLISLLSAAIAQKYGVDPVNLALEMGIKTAEGASSNTQGNNFASLYGVVPDATDETISGLSDAVNLLISIPSAERTKGDQFKLSLLQVALITLQTKKFDKNGDGQLSAEELLAMNGADASAILNNLDAAIVAIAAGTEGANAEKVAEKLSSIKADIAAQPGATDEEKLKNFLARYQAQSH